MSFIRNLLGLSSTPSEIVFDGPVLQQTSEQPVRCSGVINSKYDIVAMTYNTEKFSGLVQVNKLEEISKISWNIEVPLVEGTNTIVFSAIDSKSNKIEKFIVVNYIVPLSEKELATKEGKPWVNVLGFSLNTDNTDIGSFELDWNDIFLAQLKAAGYKGDSEEKIVDQWFQNICRNIIAENYEQDIADPEKRLRLPGNKTHLGDGRFSVE